MMQKEQIPSYDQAFQAYKNGDDEIVKNSVFAFKIYDAEYIGKVIEAVRKLLSRPDLTPRQIVGIGHALHGLNRLPLRTSGLDVELSLLMQNESGAESYDLYFTVDGFRTDSGGYVDFGPGSDSFSGPSFEVEPEYRGEEGWSFGSLEWPAAFSEMSGAELRVVDLSDDRLLDWEHPDGSIFWEWIADHA
jgi:hypothetical protein